MASNVPPDMISSPAMVLCWPCNPAEQGEACQEALGPFMGMQRWLLCLALQMRLSRAANTPPDITPHTSCCANLASQHSNYTRPVTASIVAFWSTLGWFVQSSFEEMTVRCADIHEPKLSLRAEPAHCKQLQLRTSNATLAGCKASSPCHSCWHHAALVSLCSHELNVKVCEISLMASQDRVVTVAAASILNV